MRIKVIKFGRPAYSQYEELVENYVKRVSRYVPVEQQTHREESEKRKGKIVDQLLDTSGPGTQLICLDERGKPLSTKKFALEFKNWKEDPSIKEVVFVIGGPYGVDPRIQAASQQTIRLAEGVLSSDLAWLVLWEQVYRSIAILENIAYHHE